MRKYLLLFVIFFILLICGCSAYAVPIDEDLKLDIVNRYSGVIVKDGYGWNQWKDGVKKDYNFDLTDLLCRFEFVVQEENETHIAIGFRLSIIGLANDSSEIKKRVVSKRVMLALYTKNKEFLNFFEVQCLPNVIVDGWDGKDA